MNQSNHTPGPWSVFEPKSQFVCYEGGDSPATIVSGGVHIATMPGVRTLGLSETARSNARLIASAPELLRALEWIVDDWERVTNRTLPDDHEAKAAIAKAKGGAA